MNSEAIGGFLDGRTFRKEVRKCTDLGWIEPNIFGRVGELADRRFGLVWDEPNRRTSFTGR